MLFAARVAGCGFSCTPLCGSLRTSPAGPTQQGHHHLPSLVRCSLASRLACCSSGSSHRSWHHGDGARKPQALLQPTDTTSMSPARRNIGLLIIGMVDIGSFIIAVVGSSFIKSIYIGFFAASVTYIAYQFTKPDS